MKTHPARRPARIVARAAAVLAVAAFGCRTASAAPDVNLLETGSTLLYPLFNLWVPDFTQKNPDLKITTQGTGSGAGISETISKVAQIGASDAYMSNAQIRGNKGILNIPLAISSQMVNYNVPGLSGHLNLSGPVLAGVYQGQVSYWDDPAIAKLNPGVKLPHEKIVPIHRTDGSGDTFIFTQYLAASTPAWANSVGYGTTVSWPAIQGGIGAQGNPGMVNAAKGTPYSIAYIGVSFRSATDAANLGQAALQNKDGQFVLPDQATVSAAVKAMSAKTPKDERISLIFAPGAQSYPIINYEYAIVNQEQPSPAVASALRSFLGWAISQKGGNAPKYLSQVGFVALPSDIAALSHKQISEIR
jgi:phosphate transport system substrate-binding protein